ncbi:glycosyltransferase family protein [Allorhodopirellula solitaria]|uniref:Glycosyltransferase subfamily 4-like N-terminal domain-containing protein n=1 Tax=Allorhodopirellula solitaria TaxID=2527987 RepID=A0A5C5X279_9BACT|nr:glycosyltransferase family 4 protein [Allorhodopirellula solitaria]TWT56361.1 hypothetical protein CA85_43640 [Allorhodopirellula solitaria]
MDTIETLSMEARNRQTRGRSGNHRQLAYVGDVSVEGTFHGSAVLYRLFSKNPDQCRIIELGRHSDPENRVEHAFYENVKYASQNLRRSGLGDLGRLVNYTLLESTIRRVRRSCEDVDAIVTVAHGLGWLVADAVARQLHKPLHLIVHDYPSQTFPRTPLKTQSIERAFLQAYVGAASRMCVSPYMESYYRERTGTPGSVLLPGRSQVVSDQPYAAARVRGHATFTIGLFGTVYSESSLQILRSLAQSIQETFGAESRINIYGVPPGVTLRSRLSKDLPIQFRGYIPASEFVALLREELDALFLPIPFEETSLNMRIHFPSKLTDYTATGLPILVCGPRSSSALKWTSQFPDAFIACDAPDGLPAAVARMQHYDDCVSLGANSYAIGNEHFDYSLIGNQFWDTIQSSVSPRQASELATDAA